MKTARNGLVRTTLKACSGVGAVLLAASTAAADSTTTYAGSECQGGTINGNQGGPIEGWAFSGGATQCPLTRIVSDDTTDISTILIRVEDNSGSDWITCRAVSCAGNGSACSESAEKASGTTQSFTGKTYMNMGSLPAHDTGYAYIYCGFPSSSWSYVYSYRATD